MITRNLFLSPDSGAGAIIQPKSNSQNIKIEKAEGKMPDSLKEANLSVEQLPELDSGEGYVPTAEKVIEEIKKVEEKKEEPVVEEKKADEEVKKVEDNAEGDSFQKFLKPPKGSQAEKDLKTKKGSQDTFDYSGYSEDETSILKNMPAGNREKVGKLFKESKDYAKSKENQFYQHEEGYLLHPGYRQEVNAIGMAEREARIWAKQLKDVKEGIAIKPLTGFDPKTGEPVYGNEVKASSELEEAVRENMNQCMLVANNKRTAVSNFVKNFSSLAGKDMEALRAERAKRFVWVADPKLLDHVIEVEGVGEKSIRQVRSDIASLFPAYMRNNEAVEACGDLMVALMIAKAELNQSKKGKRIEKVKKEEENLLEPSGDIKPKRTSEPVHGVKTFSTEQAGVEI